METGGEGRFFHGISFMKQFYSFTFGSMKPVQLVFTCSTFRIYSLSLLSQQAFNAAFISKIGSSMLVVILIYSGLIIH